MTTFLVSVLTVTAVFWGSLAPAHADSGGLRGFFERFRSERRADDDQRDDRQEVRSNLASKSQELRLNLERTRNAERRERLEQFWDKASARLAHLLGRQEALAARIGERLQRFEGAGADTSQPRALLETAEQTIEAADVALAQAKTVLAEHFGDGDGSVTDLIAELRTQHRLVVEAIRAAHRALVDVIVSARGLSVTPSPEPGT